MKWLLLANLFIGTLLAVAGWIANDSTTEQRGRITLLWGVTFVSALIWASLFALQRNRSQKLAGQRLFGTEPASNTFPRLSNLLNRVGILVYVIGLPWMLLRITYKLTRGEDANSIYPCIGIGMIAGIFFASFVILYWNKLIWICDNGLLRGLAYLPWRDFISHHHHPHNSAIVVLTGRVHQLALTLPPEDRDAIEDILRAKIGCNDELRVRS
jgi:hypothetical protein